MLCICVNVTDQHHHPVPLAMKAGLAQLRFSSCVRP